MTQNDINTLKMIASNCDIPKCQRDMLTEIIKKEEKYVWHNLIKNPDDLPKDEEVLKEYLVAYQNFNNPNEIVVGCFTWNGVRFLENYDYSEIPYFENKNVLFAWCELPKFEE